MANKATLHYDGRDYELPVIIGTEGEKALDIRGLRDQTGLITLDSGYGNTGACASEITFLDGEVGILRHRGYAIEDLAEHGTFMETAYLLIYGDLPTRAQYDAWIVDVTRHTLIHENLRHVYQGFPLKAHPMAILSSMLVSMSAFYQDQYNAMDRAHSDITIRRLLAKIPTIAAFSYKKSIGQPFIYPENHRSYAENLLHMLFAVPCEESNVDPVMARALDQLLILHADHEQNCSTSTVRLVGSSQANLYAAVSAACCALWGPLHGGANQAVVDMLGRIQQDGGDVKKYVELAKKKDSNFRLMGFGHRVYKIFDPRAKIIRDACDRVLKKLGIKDPMLDIATELAEAARSDDYFIERNLYPNVDFYSGVLYRALGIPTDMFTVMFAIGRMPGWIAQWKEMITSPDTRIGRPRQVYTGPPARPYVPIDKR
ncbi:MAG: citrate synthase [Phycisphaerales bacterium]|nr:citrate synthase [Phycisphaerales bacterium]